MTSRTNIPISETNRIFHTLNKNFTEDKIPLQYALELNTLDLEEAQEKKQLILQSLDAKERLDIQREINSRQIVEISKLKEKAVTYDKFLEYAEKAQRVHETRRGSQPAPFTPREGIISLVPMDFKEFVDYKNLKAELQEWKTLLIPEKEMAKKIQTIQEWLIKKYGEFVNNPAHTEEWKLLEQISEIMREA